MKAFGTTPKFRIIKPVMIRISKDEFIALRDVRAADLETLSELVKGNSSDGDVAWGLIKNQIQLYRGSRIPEEPNWSESFLVHVVQRWSAKSSIKKMVNQGDEDFNEYFEELKLRPTLAKFRNLLTSYLVLFNDKETRNLAYRIRMDRLRPDYAKAFNAFSRPHGFLLPSYALNRLALDHVNQMAKWTRDYERERAVIANSISTRITDLVRETASIVSAASAQSIANWGAQNASLALAVAKQVSSWPTLRATSLVLPYSASSGINANDFRRLALQAENSLQVQLRHSNQVLFKASQLSGILDALRTLTNKSFDFPSLNLNLQDNYNLILEQQTRFRFGVLNHVSNVANWYSRYAQEYLIIFQAREVLEESGFGLIGSYIGFSSALRITSFPQGNRSGAVTKLLLKFTTSAEFLAQIERIVRSSPQGELRWKAVEQCMRAHLNGDYYTSSATLLSVVEGLVNDCLLKHRLAFNKGNKMMMKSRDGTIVRNSKNKHQPLAGLDSKLQHLGREGADLSDIHLFIDPSVPPQRNRVLHGNKMKFGTARFSVKLVLTVLLCAHDLTDYNHRLQM